MAWTLTHNLDDFTARAGDGLRADPVRQTVALTVLATLRAAGRSAFGDKAPVYGWHQAADGTADGAFLQTPPFPVLVATLPAAGEEAFIRAVIAGHGLPRAVDLPGPAEAGFLAAWPAITGGTGTAHRRSRLFRLGGLVPPDPMPPGAARVATAADRDLLVSWHLAFHAEAAGVSAPVSLAVDDRLGHRGFTLWEAHGQPVAMAGRSREVAGVVRVTTVYTPPEFRRHGYGGAVTTASTQAALDGGAQEVVLYTDLANPTSNALYRRLGYQPVGDRVVLDLETGPHQPDVTAAGTCSSQRS